MHALMSAQNPESFACLVAGSSGCQGYMDVSQPVSILPGVEQHKFGTE